MKTKQTRETILFSIIVILLICLINIPLFVMVMTSLKPTDEVMQVSKLFPSHLSLENYNLALTQTSFALNIYNSIVNAGLVVVIITILAAMTGYALSRYRSRFFRVYSRTLFMLYIFPGMLVLLPLFTMFQTFHLVDTRGGIVLAYLASLMPFSIWMAKGFFDGIPFEIEEAAMIEGASQFRSFLAIVMPLSVPGLAAVAINAFVSCWKEYMMANILLRSDAMKPITVGLTIFVQQFTTEWGGLLAGATLSTIPVVFFLAFAQKYIVQGLTAGAVKA